MLFEIQKLGGKSGYSKIRMMGGSVQGRVTRGITRGVNLLNIDPRLFPLDIRKQK